ncbi:MAG: hypothetical protein ACJAV5_001501 [Vicingaceae bacterium]|jgi:hypothetical protein
MINDFIIPVIFIGIGLWMKSIKREKPSRLERFWWAFVTIGVVRIILELIGLSMQ